MIAMQLAVFTDIRKMNALRIWLFNLNVLFCAFLKFQVGNGTAAIISKTDRWRIV